MLGAIGGLIGAGLSFLGKKKDQKNAAKQSAQEYQRQKEFAQTGIQWKVADAKKAGIAPLAALGSSPISYAPQSVGNFDFGSTGQDIGRAIQAAQSGPTRVDAFTRTAQALELERGGLQNDLLRAQIAKLTQPGTGPGIAVDSDGYLIPGQPNSGVPGTQMQPSKYSATTAGVPYQQAGTTADVHYADTAGGGKYPIPSAVVKQQIEDMTIPELMWSIRNNILPMFGDRSTAPNNPNRAWDDEEYFDPIWGWKTRKAQTYRPKMRVRKW